MSLRKDRSQLFMDISEQHIGVNAIAEDHIAADDIEALIDHLPPGYRTVFNLYAIDGYSHQEIAAILDISESASRSQLTHARATLKKILRKHGWT